MLTTVDPTGDSSFVVAGALLIGTAVGLTLTPVLWIAAFLRRRIAYRGAWTRAIRRAALSGLVVALLVVVRSQGALTVPLAAFLVVVPLLVELTLSTRR